MHPSYLPNVLLAIVKWPVALLTLCALPFAVLALEETPLLTLTFHDYEWLLYGAGGYFVAWFFIFAKRVMGSYFSTFEHELTHALFAWATLHRVTGLTVTWRRGGACTYEGSGGGNWLISIAPYWFPTLVGPPVLALHFMDPSYVDGLELVIGVTVAYHITSTWRETHWQQPDLHQTSFSFAWMFLPTANLLAYASILLMVTAGNDVALNYLESVWEQTYGFMRAGAARLL